MDQQKVFPTACFGFDKKVVLDYIYEQDTAAKNREAEYERRIGELEAQAADLQSRLEELSAQCDLAKAQLYSEKEASAAQKASYDKLRSDADQLVQVARNKDNELQIQMELNRQLQNRNAELEGRISALSRELEEAKAAPAPEGLVEEAKARAAELLAKAEEEAAALREKAKEEASPEAERLRGELSELRETVKGMLTRFETQLEKLEGEEKAAGPEEENGGFFPREPGRQGPAGRVKVKVRR